MCTLPRVATGASINPRLLISGDLTFIASSGESPPPKTKKSLPTMRCPSPGSPSFHASADDAFRPPDFFYPEIAFLLCCVTLDLVSKHVPEALEFPHALLRNCARVL
jgi:hypothetical protein